MKRYAVMLQDWPEHEHIQAQQLGVYRWRWVARLVAFWHRSGTNRVWVVEVPQ